MLDGQAVLVPQVVAARDDVGVADQDLALIKAGLGISLVPASVLGNPRHRGLTIRQPPGTAPARDIYLLYRKRPTALVADMITVITQRHPKPRRLTST